MILENKNIKVTIDTDTGDTIGIFDPRDNCAMNWIMPFSGWGEVDGFERKGVRMTGGGAEIVYQRKFLRLTVKKEITENGYYETYSLENTFDVEYFLNKENFGIKFPYACNYSPCEDMVDQRCISHIWCGGDVCLLYSAKLHGRPPYLVMHMVEGSIDDYSISYDISKATIGAYYRGAPVLHPSERIILPGEKAEYKLLYSFCDEKPDEKLPPFENAIRFTADKYTLKRGEAVKLTLEAHILSDNAKMYCKDLEIACERSGDRIIGTCRFEETGERKIYAEIDGKKTWLYLNVISSVDELLKKRAEFITQKQQYHHTGSHLDGAYLIYDNETKSLFCESDGAFDHNAARERIGMGVTVCRALQKAYDEDMFSSLKLHRQFMEREIFCEDTGFVCNDVCRNSGWKRIFNFPWLSTYYLEWYDLTKEKRCIGNAANILIRFFELAEYSKPAQCVEAVRICEALEREGLLELKEALQRDFLTYTDNIMNNLAIDGETSYVSEIPSIYTAYNAQAFILTGEEKFLDRMESSLLMLKAFFGKQPDYHLNCIPVRYWDRYWFGKLPSYGDVFPHYWGALAAWAMAWYDRAKKCAHCHDEIRENLLGNICIFREDGTAYNNYLYPHKITLYTSDPSYRSDHLKPGITYGKKYDAWANDQDWAIYYASLFAE